MCSVSQSCPTLWDPMDYTLPGSSVHGIFSGKNTGVGCHFLLQGMFPTQVSNPYLFSSVQPLSRVQLFAIPWTATSQTSLSITSSWSLPNLMSIESMMPSKHLIFCCPLFLLPPSLSQHQGLFQWVSSSHQVAKVLEFQLQHQSFQ